MTVTHQKEVVFLGWGRWTGDGPLPQSTGTPYTRSNCPVRRRQTYSSPVVRTEYTDERRLHVTSRGLCTTKNSHTADDSTPARGGRRRDGVSGSHHSRSSPGPRLRLLWWSNFAEQPPRQPTLVGEQHPSLSPSSRSNREERCRGRVVSDSSPSEGPGPIGSEPRQRPSTMTSCVDRYPLGPDPVFVDSNLTTSRRREGP